jgi:hypothetical protein
MLNIVMYKAAQKCLLIIIITAIIVDRQDVITSAEKNLRHHICRKSLTADLIG